MPEVLPHPGFRIRLSICAVFLCLAIGARSGNAQSAAPTIAIRPPAPANSWIRLSSSLRTNSVIALEASTNLTRWQEIGTLHDALFDYPDAGTGNFPWRFYRLHSRARGPADDGKNQILFPTEPFRSAVSSDMRWVKFAILLDDPTRVYYQDTTKFPFHYDFASRRLAPFLGLSPAEFYDGTMYRSNQQAVLGTVLYPPGGGFGLSLEYGVQFVGADAYTADEIARWFELVKATVYSSNDPAIFYMPTFEQGEMARTNAAAFAARGIPVSSVERWVLANSCYSPGWALGTLKYFPASEISAAFADGRLWPEDILLTDGIPAEMPLVAGILSLTASTPNSHTAILALSFGIPFAYLPDAAERARVQSLVGHKVLVRAMVISGVAQVKVLALDALLDPAFEAELLALKQPEPIEYLPKQPAGVLSASTDTLVPTDIRFFGGKAANFGLLRRCVPTNSPEAIAFSFDLWDAFLDQALPGGQTLRAQIASRLAPYTHYPPDILSLKAELTAIRDLFTKTAAFTPAQKASILAALSGFNPSRKIRFRSSTNVEDSEHFTGAGLYDSYSGCLLDDLDGDTAGPCGCDPEEPAERGVFRALQKVYASFYNDNAFLERLHHGVDETQVGMGVLVHYSFPDDEELANGVATLRFVIGSGSTNVSGNLVAQPGAASVTNPDGTSVPEVVHVSQYNDFVFNLTFKQHSSLIPLGDYVLSWPGDYYGFMPLFTAVGTGFANVYPVKKDFTLDFEYKLDSNLGRVVKQVREIPGPGATNTVIAFLVDEPTTYSVLQYGPNIFALHRLKSLSTLHTANLRMAGSNLVNGIYTGGTFEYCSNDTRQVLSGPLNTWPGASNSPNGTVNAWITGSGTSLRSWRLTTTLTTNVPESQPPILMQNDFSRELAVTYASPVFTVVGSTLVATTNESVFLQPRPEGTAGAQLQQRTFTTNGVTIATSFYFPNPAAGVSIGSVPLLCFVETHISGLTTLPIVLTNYYSQTYGAYNHNGFERFLFEPRLEPGLSAATLAELKAANIQLVYLIRSLGVYSVQIVGFDQTVRAL